MEAGYDAVAWVSGVLMAGAATRDLPDPARQWMPAAVALAVVSVLPPACGLLAGLYRGRYLRGSVEEVLAIAWAGIATSAVLLVAGVRLVPGQRAPQGTVATGALVAIFAMLSARYMVFAARQRAPGRPAPSAIKIIVFGAGSAGAQLVQRLTAEQGAGYQPVALLDDDPGKRRLRVCGVPVLGDRTKIAEVAAATGATVLVIAIARADGTVIRDITAAAERCGLTPKIIPTITELLSGGARIDGVRDPRISDLLGRRPIQTDLTVIGSHFSGKRVLVTGAGGSIGAELCRQLHLLGPAELIMLDRDESALHAVQLALHGRALLDSEETVLADIRDPARVRQVFQRFQPQVVFHAAALKHLPLLERYPGEALKTNVLGTVTLLETAAECGVEAFVNISTDKAADPTSVLGYSKRIAERLTAHTARVTGHRYLSVRFGNVLGSRGSVLTALSAQIASGGPLTVTHPEVTRYFMTADEAVQLVLQAAAIGQGGEVLVLDMGEPVRIADIARRLVAASNRKIDIVFTGLRPGEKLTEDLLGRGEADERPRHPLIRHAAVSPLTPGSVTGAQPGGHPAGIRSVLAALAGGENPAVLAGGEHPAALAGGEHPAEPGLTRPHVSAAVAHVGATARQTQAQPLTG